MEVETIVAMSLMMAVFSAVAAVGTSIVLGAGFERLRTGFEVIRKQTGFFSDAIQKLELKVEEVDEQTGKFSTSINTLEAKVTNVGEQANAFSQSMQDLKRKVETVDKQTGFFSTAIHDLEKKIETTREHEEIVSEKMKKHAETDLISTGKAEALVSHAEDLLSQVSMMASRIQDQQQKHMVQAEQEQRKLALPQNLSQYVYHGEQKDSESGEIRFH